MEDVVLTHPPPRYGATLAGRYAAASPPEVLARGWVLARRPDVHHRGHVATVGAGVRGVPAAELVAAEVTGVAPDDDLV